jgi:hypothetical protein
MCRAWTISEKGISVTLKETHESIYEWNDGEFLAEDPAPNTTLPSPYDVNIPKNLKVESGNKHLQIKADGTVISGMRVSFDQDNHYRSEFSYKKQEDTIYNYLPLTEANIIYIRDVEDEVFYDVRVRLQNSLGVWSDYVEVHHKALGKTAKPTDVADLTVTVMPDGTRLFKWSKVLDIDLAGYVVKHGSGGWDTMKPLYDGVITTNRFESNELPKGNYTFAVKAVDTSSNESKNATFVTATLGDPRLGDSIFYKSHNGNWGNNLPANTAVGGGKLFWSKETVSQVDTEFLNVTGWDTWTPKKGDFTYETEVIDLTQEINILPYIYTDSDGTSTVQMSTSNNGTAFTPYIDISVTQTRYIKFKLAFTNTSFVNDIIVNLTGKSKELILADLDTTKLSYNDGIILPARGFSLIGSITVVMQNVGPGFSYEVTSKNPPLIKIYNSLGARADALIDVTIRGL